MKRLGLLRHAKSEWDDLSTRDFDRRLNAKGRRGAALMGEHIREHGPEFSVLLASPAERVKRTLEAALPEYDPVWDRRIYLGSAEMLEDVLRDGGGDADSVLLVGHNPGIQDLIFDLVSPSDENRLFDEAARKFPTASFAVLELDIESWADLRRECARLVHFTRPRDLDPSLGPEENV